MTELPLIPTDPAGLKAWAESIDPNDLRAVVQRMAGVSGDDFFGPRTGDIRRFVSQIAGWLTHP